MSSRQRIIQALMDNPAETSRQIAERCGASVKYVAEIRALLDKNGGRPCLLQAVRNLTGMEPRRILSILYHVAGPSRAARAVTRMLQREFIVTSSHLLYYVQAEPFDLQQVTATEFKHLASCLDPRDLHLLSNHVKNPAKH